MATSHWIPWWPGLVASLHWASGWVWKVLRMGRQLSHVQRAALSRYLHHLPLFLAPPFSFFFFGLFSLFLHHLVSVIVSASKVGPDIRQNCWAPQSHYLNEQNGIQLPGGHIASAFYSFLIKATNWSTWHHTQDWFHSKFATGPSIVEQNNKVAKKKKNLHLCINLSKDTKYWSWQKLLLLLLLDFYEIKENGSRL